ncbi:MAG: hypothetical protein AB7G75_21960 [Candidatus Binatia bacterium]
MAEQLSQETLTSALTLLSVEELPAELLSALNAALERATRHTAHGVETILLDGQRLIERSMYGSLSFFVPSTVAHGAPNRLATFDRRGHLLLLIARDASGHVTRFKARGLDGRFLGVERGAASHIGWGLSDSIVLLDGEQGFTVARPITLFRSVTYEDLEYLPPLDDPVRLPTGAGSTVLNVLAQLACDQGKAQLRYRGPYPTERLFATLNESFRYRGELGVARERFTEGAEEIALQMAMKEAPIDWEPRPHERFFPEAQTCVQLRDGVEKVYDHNRVYYRPDVAASAHAIRTERTEDEQQRYIAGLILLGQPIENHLVLNATGEILARPAISAYHVLRGPAQLSDDWKAVLVRLIAAESAALLRPALWPVMDELTLTWEPLRHELWSQAGNMLSLHAGMVTVYRQALTQIRSAGEGLLLAARFTSELARLLGPLVRARAQEQLANLSPEAQQVSLFFSSSSSPEGLPDNDLRSFLTKLALGEELPKVEMV